MKVLLSGKNGFLGQSLSRFLEGKGYQTFGIPRQLLLDRNKLAKYVDEINPLYVFHLGAYGNHFSHTDRDLMFDSNIIGSWNLMQTVKKGLILTGSSSEYGVKDSPMRESDSLNPTSFYGATKAAVTMLAKQSNAVVVRPFSVYGELEADYRFIPKAIRAINAGEVFQIDRKPKHDWIYIEDFLEALYLVALSSNKLGGKVINIGTGKQYSNVDVIKKLEKVSGKKLDLQDAEGLRDYDSNNWVADNSLIKALGWKQKYSLENGLREVYEK